jgi:phosphatidylinositol alpha-mannosyltransferase
VGFLGRFDEPRKGFDVLVPALEQLIAARPGLRLLVAGPGDTETALAAMSPGLRGRVPFLGLVSEAEKEQMLRSVDLYVAPNTGGESFGIILTEAMAAGTPVVASDIDAFRRVLEDGACGALFPVGDVDALAATIADLLDDPARRAVLSGEATRSVKRYDWAQVAADVVAVYETVTAGTTGVLEDTRTQRLARLVGLSNSS